MAKSTTKNELSNTNIYYYGGTCGYFCLHLLLLSGKYDCYFKSGFNFSEVFEFQWLHKKWNNDNVKSWKMLEYTIDNFQTKDSDINHKIFLWGNKPARNGFPEPDISIVIYTDIWTHFRMSYEKKCFWFDMLKDEPANKETITEILGTYDQNLTYDEQMRDYELCKSFLDKQSVDWGNDRIYHKFKTVANIDSADVVVKVQDIIKTEGKCLYDPLGLQVTDEIRQFIKDYVELHPPILRSLLHE